MTFVHRFINLLTVCCSLFAFGGVCLAFALGVKAAFWFIALGFVPFVIPAAISYLCGFGLKVWFREF